VLDAGVEGDTAALDTKGVVGVAAELVALTLALTLALVERLLGLIVEVADTGA
jgi:hypothetical protein